MARRLSRARPRRGAVTHVGVHRPALEALEDRILLAGEVLYRINAGGPLLSGTPNWLADSATSPSTYSNPAVSGSTTFSTSTSINMTHPSLPPGVPMAMFQTERWDPPAGGEMQWDFPVSPGFYEVRLYFADIYVGTQAVNARKFDVYIEGTLVLNDYDIYAEVGGYKAVMKSFTVTTDANLDIDFAHVIENPAVKGIEILTASQAGQLAASPSAVNFGNVGVGATASQTITLTNLGSAGDPAIVISSASLGGANPAAFGGTFGGIVGTNLSPGQSVSFAVTFTPPAAQSYSASLSIGHSGVNSPVVVSLSGDGIAQTTGAQAQVVVDPGGTISDSSTYTGRSFAIQNTSTAGQKISTISFDLRTALLPDQVFDPNGTAGDPVGKTFTADDGYVATGLAGHQFLSSHDGGFDVLQISFADFDPGEQFFFSVDIDPTSIKGAPAPGPEHAGSMSGLELMGSAVTIQFSDGTTATGELFRIASSVTGSANLIRQAAPAKPGLSVLGVATTPATVTVASQTIRLTGPVGSTVAVVVTEAALLLDTVPGGGFDIDPYEANKVIAVTGKTATIGASGYVDVPVTLTKTHSAGGLNYIAAAIRNPDGQTGPVAKVVLQYNPSAVNQPPAVNAGADQVITLPQNTATLSGVVIDDGLPVPPGAVTVIWSKLSGPGTVSFSSPTSPTTGATFSTAGAYVLRLTASDGQLSSFDDVAVTVQQAPAGVVYRINAGGPAVSATPSWQADTQASPSAYSNAPLATNATFSTTSSINMSHASIPAGTPMSLFQTERWDPPAGAELQWNFPVTPGQYVVRLYFADIYVGTQTVGARKFDVYIEGQLVLNDYDVFAEVGGYAGVVKSFTVNADSNLDIDFAHVVENPAVKAIEILSTAAQANQLGASTTAVSFGSVTVATTASQTVTLTNLGGAGDAAITISSASLGGANPTAFGGNYAGLAGVTLLPGQSTSFQVTFTPTASQSYSASLTIGHSGINTPLTISLSGTGTTGPTPVSFGKSTLAGASLSKPTSLQFGPDGKLYVAQQNGLIKVYSITKNAANSYFVSSSQTITLIHDMPNYNDNGVLNPTIIGRQVTGILVTGTAANPVIYVTSSDPRIGAGGSGIDLNLDTNSGIISKLTWTGSTWQKIDLVRGLPRSEENHSLNGMQLDPVNNILYVAAGGNTNMGAPSNNFAYLTEYALSAAILSVDLNAIGGTTYDLPTLDDEDRPGTIDAGDPFGGNDGKNQAKLVPGGPVQIHASGFRNAYDLVITADGRMYSIDNGSNAGWGGTPIGTGGSATNQVSEPGITEWDQLHYITGAGFYGGHPNPTRANTANTFNSTNPQSPVSVPNPAEGTHLAAGVADGALTVFEYSTNGMVEYTASNFGGAMQGDLLAASFDGKIYRVKLDATGTGVVLKQALFTNVAAVPLDVTALPDAGPFPGTVWVCDWQSGAIIVFEPATAAGGAEYSWTIDDDGDGYFNADEIDNGTDPLSAGDVPADWDKDFLSNLNDTDDDNDGLLDTADPFAIDHDNGRSTALPIQYSWNNGAPSPGGILNMGFTGLMTNGVSNYESLYNPANMTAGGAAGVLTIDQVPPGDAVGNLNTQEYAFQFGLDVGTSTAPFVVRSRIMAPFAGLTPNGYQSMGIFIGAGNQDNYIKLVVSANLGLGGIELAKEVGGVFTSTFTQTALPGPSFIDLCLTVTPATGTVQGSFCIDGGAKLSAGSYTFPASWLTGQMGLAAGIISTSYGGTPFPATWDFIEVLPVV